MIDIFSWSDFVFGSTATEITGKDGGPIELTDSEARAQLRELLAAKNNVA